MIQIIDGRGTGKTSRLMLMAKELNLPIACLNPEALKQKAYVYGITGLTFISFSELGSKERHIDKVLVDEIDQLAQFFIRGKIAGYTLSEE